MAAKKNRRTIDETEAAMYIHTNTAAYGSGVAFHVNDGGVAKRAIKF